MNKPMPERFTLRVNVDYTVLDNPLRQLYFCCPVSVAVRRAANAMFGYEFSACTTQKAVVLRRCLTNRDSSVAYHAMLPVDVQDRVFAIDNGENVSPFVFELDFLKIHENPVTLNEVRRFLPRGNEKKNLVTNAQLDAFVSRQGEERP